MLKCLIGSCILILYKIEFTIYIKMVHMLEKGEEQIVLVVKVPNVLLIF
jgi:hypothetical protein